jgi:hypothetical protein
MKALLFLFSLGLWVSCHTPDRLVLPCDQLVRIEVNDRGLFVKGSNPTRVINSKDSIERICRVLMQSKKVRYQNIAIRDSRGLVDIYLYYKNGDDYRFPFFQTNKDGGIIIYSDDFYLRNDELIHYLWYPVTH